ncbi:complex I subunit 5 family protein [Hydrogenophaga sp.]|uniref:complex I subunit 5 family protein n=1 Tax=Hydrogenophaga sp. TaxID=1904254 RepID=UPI002727BDA7|nr:proton-conducting transporter membrane subunit [Hydrogenophaga sp.]MDO8904814.1 proton-conducting transporter membrane subunit [Hydrogenophaga sp.]
MTAALPVLILLTSLVPALFTFFLRQDQHRLRNTLNLSGAVLKLGLIAFMLSEVAQGTLHEVRLDLAPGLYLLLRVDALSLLFLTLSAFLWLLTTIYAIAYFGRKPDLSRFFGFFSLCVFATTGIALSGTLITFFIFFELLTLSTWPLVVHKGDDKSLKAGTSYLAYSLPASAALLVAIVWLEGSTGPVAFAEPADLGALSDHSLRMIFVLFIVGLGAKSALLPLHGWLPSAMAAPAPVSALLHAVAVVKAGAFGIVRVVHDVFGISLVQELGMGLLLAMLASATIIYGSARALAQTDIKRRLAFSTVSQVSYVILGIALGGPIAAIGGLAHLVHQGLMKITLFFCAGIFTERAGIVEIRHLDGIGQRMPWTATAFSLAALGMIGMPPLAGFVSKWYLGLGGLQVGAPWVVAVLICSALLNAAYFLPLLYRIWYGKPREDAPALTADGPLERPLGLIAPPVITALACLAAGLLAASALSPLGWATRIVEGYYP